MKTAFQISVNSQ